MEWLDSIVGILSTVIGGGAIAFGGWKGWKYVKVGLRFVEFVNGLIDKDDDSAAYAAGDDIGEELSKLGRKTMGKEAWETTGEPIVQKNLLSFSRGVAAGMNKDDKN